MCSTLIEDSLFGDFKGCIVYLTKISINLSKYIYTTELKQNYNVE